MGALLLVTAVVFWLLFRGVSLHEVRDTLARARPLPLALGIALTVSFPWLSAWRWRAMMRALGHDLSFVTAFRLIMACWPLSTFTPSKGSDLAKAYFLRGRIPVGLVLSSVLVERWLDVVTLLVFCLAGAIGFGWTELALPAAGLLAVSLAAVPILFASRRLVPAKLRPKADRLLEAWRQLARRPGLLALVLSLTVANWLASVVQTWLFYQALGAAVPFPRLLAALPAAIFVGLLPVTVMGMGTRDAALIGLMAGDAPRAVSLGVGLLYSLCGYWLPGLAGLPFLRQALRRPRVM
jgi:uncharacterized membrane protein YbhN (UPF0104 family)